MDTQLHPNEGRAQRRPVVASPTAWFALAFAGMIVVFAGLATDAYRHNNGAGEESLVSLSNPGHVIAGIGIAAVSLSALAGMTASVVARAETVSGVLRGGALVTAAWMALTVVAVTSLTYVAATDVTVGHSSDQGAAGQPAASTGGDGPAAAADDAHDYGVHPTFTELVTLADDQLLPRFPDNSVSDEDLVILRDQVKRARLAAARFPTTDAATAAGYEPISVDAEAMGQHWINFEYLSDGEFAPSKPEGLLFSKLDGGDPQLVGVWFLQLPGSGGATETTPPEGFAGSLDLWHGPTGICLIGAENASLGTSREDCDDRDGTFFEEARWMMHVWVAPGVSENPDGFFAYLNRDLAANQVDAVPLGEGGF